jgi:hypothetical protein
MTNLGDKLTQSKVPVSVDAWEHMLVQYFFVVGSDGDATDIHTLEVSPVALARACGMDANCAAEVEQAFRSTLLRNQNYLLNALMKGSSRHPSQDVPNCFVPLALTLLVAGLLGGEEYENDQFRAKLAAWLKVKHKFNNLAGVRLMWEELASWLNKQSLAGRPFKRLILPEHPRNWVHIGYTLRLSFPNRTDVSTVRRVLASTPIEDLDKPTAVIHAFWNNAHKKGFSLGLSEAFDSFKRAYYSHRRALADHRFWALINHVRAGAQSKSTPLARIEIALTIDDEREFSVELDLEGDVEIRPYMTLAAALGDRGVLNSPNLGTTVSRGLIFFKQIGLGHWTAEPDLGKCRGQILAAFHDKIASRMQGRLGRTDRNVDWSLTIDPISAEKLRDELVRCGLMMGDVELFRPAVSDGIRVNGAWLGLPGFLPQIASDTSEVRIASWAGKPEISISTADGLRIAAPSPVSGTCVIEPCLAAGEREPHWRLNVQFVDHAAPHYELGGARRGQPLLADWDGSTVETGRQVYGNVPDTLAWGRADDALEWLLEAIYANGKSGWDESHIVHLLKRSHKEAAAMPWRTLRMLQDGGVIEPRLRQGWKGRVWTLAAPRIVSVDSLSGPVALAEGAFCAQMLDAFVVAAKAMGATPFRLPGASRWSVPVMGAIGANAEQLARVMQWEHVSRQETPGTRPIALATTERGAEHYSMAASWCWRNRRFLRTGANEASVNLTLFSHRADTDHDVYRVESNGKRTHFLSRCAAIVAAHAAASVSLFAFDGQRLNVTGREGALPDAIGRTLRRRTLASGGFDDGVYTYPATGLDARWVAALLPGCVSGLTAEALLTPGAALSRARRSQGVLRPQWIDGNLTL